MDTIFVLDGFNRGMLTKILNTLYFVKKVYVYNVHENSLANCEFKFGRECSLRSIPISTDIVEVLKGVPDNSVHFHNKTYKVGYKNPTKSLILR